MSLETWKMGVDNDPVELNTAAEDAQQTLDTQANEQTHQVRNVEDLSDS